MGRGVRELGVSSGDEGKAKADEEVISFLLIFIPFVLSPMTVTGPEIVPKEAESRDFSQSLPKFCLLFNFY
ncbi:hypothetical protein BZZ01_13370 [Nostocales cyanobacterium HT-58-2]|nr:hypothetical protein BZZ01_13370 [Nostocales cyanobacterium HT-58-2]